MNGRENSGKIAAENLTNGSDQTKIQIKSTFEVASGLKNDCRIRNYLSVQNGKAEIAEDVDDKNGNGYRSYRSPFSEKTEKDGEKGDKEENNQKDKKFTLCKEILHMADYFCKVVRSLFEHKCPSLYLLLRFSDAMKQRRKRSKNA